MSYHVVPTNDAVDHSTETDDCICGPTIEAVYREDGSNGWLVIHQAIGTLVKGPAPC